MKLNKLFAIFFSIMLVIIASTQIYTSIYSVDEMFNYEVENHLTSIINIKELMTTLQKEKKIH